MNYAKITCRRCGENFRIRMGAVDLGLQCPISGCGGSVEVNGPKKKRPTEEESKAIHEFVARKMADDDAGRMIRLIDSDSAASRREAKEAAEAYRRAYFARLKRESGQA